MAVIMIRKFAILCNVNDCFDAVFMGGKVGMQIEAAINKTNRYAFASKAGISV